MASSPPDPGLALRLRVLDTDLTVHCPDHATAAALRRLYAPFAQVNRGSAGAGPPTRGAGPTAAGARPAAVADGPMIDGAEVTLDGAGHTVDDLAAEINALALAGAECLAVHAGVVAHDGAVAAFPAASGAGKTTLTAACLRAGLRYVSDEALCLSWDGAGVRPYPRPLALSPWSASAVGLPPVEPEALVTAAELGADLATVPLRLAHVVLLDAPGSAPGLRPATRSDAAAELLRRSFTHWHHPQRAFELVHDAVRDAHAWRLSPSDPTTDAATIATLLR